MRLGRGGHVQPLGKEHSPKGYYDPIRVRKCDGACVLLTPVHSSAFCDRYLYQVLTMILGGSTNAVLHLIAIAHSVGIKLELSDFQNVSDRVPFIADLKPSGKYVMEDVYKIGGIPSKYLRGSLNISI